MPRISRDDQLERDLTSRLRAMIEDPATPAYVQHRCMATLATLLRRRDKRLAEKAKAAAARKAAEPMPVWNVLPSNGREPPPGFQPTHVQPFRVPPGVNRG
jgi:hypothetical protein